MGGKLLISCLLTPTPLRPLEMPCVTFNSATIYGLLSDPLLPFLPHFIILSAQVYPNNLFN